MTSLVTGAGGFIGSFLCEHLAACGDRVIELTRKNGDLGDRANLELRLRDSRPDRIFHLAAQSSPGASWSNPGETYRINMEGTINLLESVRAAGLGAVIVMAGSSSEYAATASLIGEGDPQAPSSPYAVSKIGVDHLARSYGARYGMPIVRTRPFFLIGPRKKGDVCSDFARRVVAIERREADHFPVGRMDIVCDFLDVRDGVGAMSIAATKGTPGDAYNICSGRGVPISEILAGYKSLARVPIHEREDAALIRPIDDPIKVGDPSKLKALGWTPRYSLKESLSEILEYWRCKS